MLATILAIILAAQVKAADPDGTTSLLWAVERNDVAAVEALIRGGADVRAKNDFGATPLSEAALNGNSALLEKLLNAGADVDSPNADGQTALMLVARTGNVAAARLLLKHGAQVNAVERWHGQTALMWAAAQQQPEMVLELVAHGADVDARSKINDWERQVTSEPRALHRPVGGLTPLLFASREGCVECAKAIVEAGADLNLSDPEEISPLIMSITNGHFDLASYLLRKGANPNKWDWFGRTPLYAAVDMNTLPHGGRPDRASLDETTSMQLIANLLEAGANPNPQLKLLPPYRNVIDDRTLDTVLTIGATPLLRAAKAFDAAVIKLLLAHGADVSIPNNRGVTPIMAAAGMLAVDADTRGIYTTEDTQQRSIESLKLLLAAGADINGRECGRGLTALHEAARWGWNDVIQFLVANGADLTVKDNRGMTPVDSALGKAGGNSKFGQRIDVFENTAALLRELMSKPSPSPSTQQQTRSAMKPTAAELAEFRELEVKLWQAWNARLIPADARPFYSQDPNTLHFDFTPMKFTGWAEYEKVATQAIGGTGRAETKINDDFTLIKNGDLAVTAFTFHVDFYGKDGAKRGGLDARETDVWVKEKERWVIAHQHMSLPSSPGQAQSSK